MPRWYHPRNQKQKSKRNRQMNIPPPITYASIFSISNNLPSPSLCIHPITPFKYSYVNIVVIALGIALNKFVPMPE